MEKYWEKMVEVLLIACMTLALIAGCGAKDTVENEEESDMAVSEEKAAEYTEKDLEGVVSGIEDRYILKGSEEIDYLSGVVYNEEIVTGIQADASEVDLEAAGTYKAVYTVTVDIAALEDYLKENASDQKDSEEDMMTEEIAIEKTVEVVDEKKAQELADEDKAVWKNKNEIVQKSDGTEVDQAETGEKVENVVSASDKNSTGTSGETAKKETNKKETNKNSGNSASSTGGKGNSSNGNNTASSGSSSSTSQHTHSWVAQTKVVHHDATGHYETQIIQAAYDEPVYETRIVCGCGATFASEGLWEQHSVDGCTYGYSVKKVQTGSIHHDAVTKQVWVQDSAAWDETVTTGYKCSGCGAAK